MFGLGHPVKVEGSESIIAGFLVFVGKKNEVKQLV